MNFSLSPGTVLWVVLGVAAGALLAAWAYRFALPALSGRTRGVLWTLRALGLALLVLLLARPLFSLADRGGPRDLVLLEDRSLSMSLPSAEEGADRAAVAARVTRELEEKLRGRYRVRRWQFASRALESGPDSVAALDRASTALGDALATLGGSSDVAAVVVVSDGVANRGRDPVQAARELGRPVASVVVGEAEGWDASLEEIAVNPTTRSGQRTPMEVRLRHTGETPRRATLTVSDAGGTIARREIVLPPGGTEIVERLEFVPRRIGLSYYRIGLDAGPGEITERNNARAAVQQVLPDRQSVLVLSSGVHWDWTWLKRALDADSAWTVTYGVWRDGRFRPPLASPGASRTVSLDDLRRHAVVVAVDLGPEQLGGGLGERLAVAVRSGRGLVFWGGPGAASGGLGRLRESALGRALGLTLEPRRAPPASRPRLATPENPHDVLRVDDDTEAVRRWFETLPPLAEASPLAPRPGDRVLLEGAEDATPLWLLRRVGRGRALLVNGAGHWRWGFHAGEPEGSRRYRRLWGNALRVLAEPTQTDPLRVAAERPLLAHGEDVRISASLQDASFQPVDGARVEARLQAVSGLEGGERPDVQEETLVLEPLGEGSYVSRRGPLPPGRYRLDAAARANGAVLGRAASEFLVDAWSPELQALEPDRRTLERMAQVSEAAVAEPDDLDELVRSVSRSLERTTRWRELRLWELPFLYALIVGLLSGEWWLRRRRGLP